MNASYVSLVSNELNLKESQIQAVAALLEQGATIPFIARYRKEATRSLDEVAIIAIRDRLVQLEELNNRKDAILKSLGEHGHLTDVLNDSVLAAQTLSEVEDIYLPYRPKRRTRATIAKEKGLEPLAMMIFSQNGLNPFDQAVSFLSAEKEVTSIEAALGGARDILAEKISEDRDARSRLRHLFLTKGSIISRVVQKKEADDTKFKDYYDWKEPVNAVPSHRLLAMRRGEREDILNISIAPDEKEALIILEDLFVKGAGEDSEQVRLAVHDSYKRLLSRSIETEIRLATKEKADDEAIRIFAQNLRQLLLAPPLGSKPVLAIDPGFRTGCKIVCLDCQGKLLHHDTICPHLPAKATATARTIHDLCRQYEIEAIAVGNGTAGRETEAFLKRLNLPSNLQVVLVNESGASIYSASDVARKEFPDLDLTVRGSVSIGRRLMDPLSELVKIDPKAIGVGQYQHDVDQTALKKALDDIVISCVNAVGVDVNRASVELLTYISGLGPQLARNIVSFRNEKGPFRSREDLKPVPRLGPKAFEQSAGFLRITDGSNPLDASAVHPESYSIVETIAKDLNCSIPDLMKASTLKDKIDLSRYVTDTVGMPTLEDIMLELARPGRDPRSRFEAFAFESGVEKIEDLQPGMKLPGIITNVTAFGAFVDIGVHQDGLVHISELSNQFVKDPMKIVKVHQKVRVTVLAVDLKRNRISLSMKDVSKNQSRPQHHRSGQLDKGNTKQQKKVPFHNPFSDLLDKTSKN
ncbi:MAG: Tex family protein [Desulfobacterales bacterium]|nr:Tex family protein [Desulfobacterales bacterium]